MKTPLATIFLLLTLVCVGMAGPKSTDRYPKEIVGRWLGIRKFEIYYADGTWAVQRNEASKPDKEGRRWYVEGNELTLTYPGDHGTETGVYKIVSLTAKKFVIESDGYKEEYEHSP